MGRGWLAGLVGTAATAAGADSGCSAARLRRACSRRLRLPRRPAWPRRVGPLRRATRYHRSVVKRQRAESRAASPGAVRDRELLGEAYNCNALRDFLTFPAISFSATAADFPRAVVLRASRTSASQLRTARHSPAHAQDVPTRRGVKPAQGRETGNQFWFCNAFWCACVHVRSRNGHATTPNPETRVCSLSDSGRCDQEVLLVTGRQGVGIPVPPDFRSLLREQVLRQI